MNARDDLLRAHVYAYPADAPLEERVEAVRDLVAAYRSWPARNAERFVEQARDDEAEEQDLLAWYEEIGIISDGLCHLCRRPAPDGWCAAGDSPDCYAEARRRLGIPEFQIRQSRGRDWTHLIEARNARGRAA